jgi:O-acetyl-ADP-ribose deacetylase (regulator of RNase III)
MIYQVEGDILLSRAYAIVQGVGINDPMDKGLALALHTKYPVMYKDFHRWCHQHNTRPGEAWLWDVENNIHIVNLITQDIFNRHEYRYGKATLHNIKSALAALVKIILEKKFPSIAISRLATGSGDLDWDDVWPLIDNSLGNLDIPVYVYSTYRAGQKAEEKET